MSYGLSYGLSYGIEALKSAQALGDMNCRMDCRMDGPMDLLHTFYKKLTLVLIFGEFGVLGCTRIPFGRFVFRAFFFWPPRGGVARHSKIAKIGIFRKSHFLEILIMRKARSLRHSLE